MPEGRLQSKAKPPAWPLAARRARRSPALLRQTRRDGRGFSGISERGREVPQFVEREMRAYLSCGILACGFLRLKCESCGKDRLLPLSCKGRSVCPSCCGRRMVDTAAHLVDRVFPRVPVRQWVLSLPFALRYRLAYDSTMTTAVLQVFIRALFGLYRRMARDYGIDQTQCGAVTFVQRFGSAANLHVHFQVLCTMSLAT